MKRWLVLAALVLTWPVAAHGQETFKTRLSPVPIDAQLAPTVTGHGSVSALLAGTKLNVTGSFEGMRSPATAAHLHNLGHAGGRRQRIRRRLEPHVPRLRCQYRPHPVGDSAGNFGAGLPPDVHGVERSFATDQDRLVKHLRLAQVATLEAANAFLETEYWPEWNARFARPVQEFPNQHRPLTPYLDLAAILCHVEHRVIGNDYTFSFAGRRYQIAREEAQAGMRHQRLRVELRLNGDLQARYQDRYLHLGECGAKPIAPPLAVRKPVRKDHNAGGKSAWMQDFFDRPSPPLWKLIGD